MTKARTIAEFANDLNINSGDVSLSMTGNQVIEVNDNTNAALRITQTGSGNALVVEDSANPDSTPFVVDASGNVGIGTTQNDFSKLELKTGTYNVSQAEDGFVLKLQTSEGESAFSGGLTIQTNSGGTPTVSLVSTDDPTARTFQPFIESSSIGANQYTKFLTAGTERMRIDSSGRILVGTTSTTPNPGVSLLPAGNVTCGNSAGVSGFEFATFRRSATQIGSITQSGTTGVAYNTSSDYRLKTDVQPMTGATERLKALKPVNFEWIADGTRVDGFLAHEAAEVVPEAITGEKDAVDADGNPEYQGIDQSKLVPLLTAALQEAIAKIESLESRIQALESN